MGGHDGLSKRDRVRFLALARYHSTSYADRHALARLLAACTASLPACEHVTVTELRQSRRPDDGKK